VWPPKESNHEPGRNRSRAPVTRAFVSLADTLVDEYDVIDLLDRLIGYSFALLAADAAGIVLAHARGQLRAVAASSKDAQLVDLLRSGRRDRRAFDGESNAHDTNSLTGRGGAKLEQPSDLNRPERARTAPPRPAQSLFPLVTAFAGPGWQLKGQSLRRRSSIAVLSCANIDGHDPLCRSDDAYWSKRNRSFGTASSPCGRGPARRVR
jgi:hypothetical protein